MLKKIIIIALLFVATPSIAQKWTFGAKGGVNWNTIGEFLHFGSYAGGNPTPVDDTLFEADKVMGTQFGAFAMWQKKKFLVRGEINWTNRENEYPLEVRPSVWRQNSMDISILAGYTVFDPVSLYVGPSFSSINDMTLQGLRPDRPLEYDTSATNLQVGILVDFYRWGLDLRYEYGFSAIPEQRIYFSDSSVHGSHVGDLLEYNQSTIMLTAHINIFTIDPSQGGRKPKATWRGKNCL